MPAVSSAPFIKVCETVSNPETELDIYEKQLRMNGRPYGLLYLTYPFHEYWADHRAARLSAIYLLDLRPDSEDIRAAVTAEVSPNFLVDGSDAETYPALKRRYRSWAAHNRAADIAFSDGCLLEPVYVSKPWGREVWYTGIERRGVSFSSRGTGRTPLPWVLSLAPRRLTNERSQTILLVKILEPFADPLYGNLYYELHPRKQEVYVVTEIDHSVWPDGIGEIRVGVNQEKRRLYKNARSFRAEFGKALEAYRRVRAAIDRRITTEDHAKRLALAAALTPHDKRRLDRCVPISLKKRERRQRGLIESFLSTAYVTAGDTVKILPNTPHCVQHGVRCLGYQTQDYDRLIMAFSQRVLTQADWDIHEAVATMMLAPYPTAQAGTRIGQPHQIVREQVASFPDFEVNRLYLPGGACYEVKHTTDYTIVYTCGDGAIHIGSGGRETRLSGEMVFLIFRSVCGFVLTAAAEAPLTVLMGFPVATSAARSGSADARTRMLAQDSPPRLDRPSGD